MPPRMQKPLRRIRPAPLLLLLCLLALGGCSALSFVYMNAATFGVLWIDRALDLPSAHRALLADAAAEVHAWHRGAPARELAGVLREAGRRLSGPASEHDGEWIVASAQEQVRKVGERLAIVYGPRIPPFSASEVQRMEHRLQERREEFAEEIGIGDPERERALRIERIEEAIDDWLGSVSDAQRALVAESRAVQGFQPALWLEERARRERNLVRALTAGDGGVALRAWFNDWLSGRPPEAAEALDAQRAEAIAMWVAVFNSATPDQRQHLQDRLADWAEVFEGD